MNATQDYIREREAVCRNEWFKDHQAALIAQQQVVNDAAVIEWKKPGTWNYGMRFIIHRFWLIVVGDLGEAVYGWGYDVTLDFLAGINFDYFHSKCVASESGRKFESFDGKTGFRLAQEWLAEADVEHPPGENDDHREYIRNLTASDGKDRVEEAAREIYDATGDSELASAIVDWFQVPSCRCIAHFVGLQMAIKQLAKPALT